MSSYYTSRGFAAAILCGNGCGHDHNAPNGPSGCCKEHGPYLYHCHQCHEAWREANSDNHYLGRDE
jgi:hypothetical protein